MDKIVVVVVQVHNLIKRKQVLLVAVLSFNLISHLGLMLCTIGV